jgi:uncharacterized protein YkwD
MNRQSNSGAPMRVRRIHSTFPVWLTLAAMLVACAGPLPAAREPLPDEKRQPILTANDLEQEIHALVNKERRNKGLDPLHWNSTLSRIARQHSQDMVSRQYFSHLSPEGRNFSYRYQQEGFSCSIQAGDTVHKGAENIFQNNLYDRIMVMNGVRRYDWNTAKHLAETTVRGWMSSVGHRKSILTLFWKTEGIGVSLSPDDKVYITQNFC